MAVATKNIPNLGTGNGVPIQPPVVTYAADGAITLTAGGIALLSKGSAGAYTLAAPTGDAVLHIIATSAQAHVVTVTGMAAGTGQDVGTFGGAINDSCTLIGSGGAWYVCGAPRNVTFA